MPHLADRNCAPVPKGSPELAADRAQALLAELDGWSIVDGHHLVKRYKRRDFATALELVNRFGAIAEEQNHHPDLLLAWGSVDAKIWTHSTGGLTENDFVLAAKLDAAAAVE